LSRDLLPPPGRASVAGPTGRTASLGRVGSSIAQGGSRLGTTLLDLEVDLLFFDTTSTYFETDEADPPSDGAPRGFRAYGHSKDHRPDLPQVVIGLAVTRTGIPVRVWTWPGNASDQALIRRVARTSGS